MSRGLRSPRLQLSTPKKTPATHGRGFFMKICFFEGKSEPALTTGHISRHEFLVALGQIDDAFDQTDDSE